MKRNKYILLLFLMLLTFNSCDKDIYYNLDIEFKNYFDFKEGSWWVYKNKYSNTTTDTVFVSSYTKHFEGFNKLTLSLGGRKNIMGEKIRYTINTQDVETEVILYAWEDTNSFSLQNDSIMTFYYGNNNFYRYPDHNTYFEIIPNYSTAQYSFNDVFKVWNINDSDTLWFAPNVGIVEYFINNQNYSLTKYNIEQ